MSTKILCIADMHVGSEAGIAPYEYTINDHTLDRSYKVTANKTQEKLYKKWEEMVDEVGKVDHLFLCGDLADGLNPKGLGVGVTHNDLSWQEDLAVELIQMVKVKYGNYYGCQGSNYHVGNQAGQDWGIVKTLSREAHSKFVFGDEILEEIDGKRIHARHVTSYSKIPELRQNALKRDVTEFFNEYNTLGKVDLAIRAHVHYCKILDWGGYIKAVTLPCWKGRDTFISQKSVVSPDNGYVLVEINNGEIEILPSLFKV